MTIASPADGSTLTDSGSLPPIDFTDLVTVQHQRCKYDDRAFRSCGELAFEPPRLRNGAHNFTVRTVDADGDVHHDISSFTLDDTTPPDFNASVVGGMTVSDLLQFDLTLTEQRATAFASLNGGGAERIEMRQSPLSWTPRRIFFGMNSMEFTAIDPAGNATVVPIDFYLEDDNAPVVSIVSPVSGSTLPTGDVSTEFTTNDTDARHLCAFDDAAPVHCEPDEVDGTTNLAAGAHDFTVTARDNVGNVSTTTVPFTVGDTPQSGLTITTPADGGTYGAQPLLAIDSVEELAPGSLSCSVNGGRFKRCAEGESLDAIEGNGESTLVVRAIDEAGDQVRATSDFTIADTTPPTILVSADPALVPDVDEFLPPFTVDDDYYGGQQTFENQTTCSFDGASPRDCLELFIDGEFPLTEGSHLLKVVALDWAGNAATSEITVEVTDTTPPALEIIAPTAGASLSGDFSVDFAHDAEILGSNPPQCRVDTGSWQDCGPGDNGFVSWHPGGLSAAEHVFSVRVTDRAGNASEESVTATVVAGDPPAIDFRAPVADSTITDAVIIHFDSSKPIHTVRCAIDVAGDLAVDPDQCGIDAGDDQSGWFRPLTLTDGEHDFWVEVTDNQGNAASASLHLTVGDSLAPDVYFTGSDNGSAPLSSDESPRAISFASNDPTALFECSLDSAPWQPCGSGGSSTQPLPPLADGPHNFTVRATDPSGNQSEDAELDFTVADLTAPELEVFGVHNGMQFANGDLLATTLITAGASTVECAIGSGAFADCSAGSFDVPIPASGYGELVVHYRAEDAAGNLATRSFTVDFGTAPEPPGPTPPVDPPAQPPANPGPPKATVVLAKPVTKSTRAATSVKITATVRLPAGVTNAAGCRGKASVLINVGKRTVKRASAALKVARGKCTVTATLKIKAKLIAGKKFTIALNFAGNSAIAPLTASKSAKAAKAR